MGPLLPKCRRSGALPIASIPDLRTRPVDSLRLPKFDAEGSRLGPPVGSGGAASSRAVNDEFGFRNGGITGHACGLARDPSCFSGCCPALGDLPGLAQ